MQPRRKGLAQAIRMALFLPADHVDRMILARYVVYGLLPEAR